FIKWITDPQVQAEFSRQVMNQIPGAIFIPSNREAMLNIDMPKEDLELLIRAADVGNISTYGLVAPRLRRRYLQFAAQEAILQGVDPETAIRKAAREHNAEIQKKEVEYSRFIVNLLKGQQN
ncbi:MAG: hypothetical protein WCS44_08595, partial [Bacillota bacterium]